MENWICALPDDMLVRILLLLPAKDAVATTILSKRWRSVWTMLPTLIFKDEGSESFGWFTDKSLQLHKAPILDSLAVELGPSCPVDVDVGKWVENAVNRSVRQLDVRLLWAAKPTSFPRSLYTCHTLVRLTLYDNILVDLTSPARLPSLLTLHLLSVVYKDEKSLFMFLSGCPVLEKLRVIRRDDDNLKHLTIKIPSLQILIYVATSEDITLEDNDEYPIGSLVIDCPALTYLDVDLYWEDFCLIQNMPCLELAYLRYVVNPCDMFLRSVSSVTKLYLYWTESMASACYKNIKNIKFSRLLLLAFSTDGDEDYLEPLMFFLENSPKLKTLSLITEFHGPSPPSWKTPITIPGCLSSHLEKFRWEDYGRREDEKQLLRYILANSMCLKTVKIDPLLPCNFEETKMEVESMPRISTISQLIFDPPQSVQTSSSDVNKSSRQ